MKSLRFLIIVLPLVFAISGLQNVGADQSDEDYKTGLKYYYGDGVTIDDIEAFKWFKNAADQGNISAQK